LSGAFFFVVLLGLHQTHLNNFLLHSPFTYTARAIIGKKIKFLREQKGMTQQELADLVRADRQYIYKIETGRKNITLDYLDKIAQALEVSQSEFLNTDI
jgi:DNA-binding XRE family transcriptional regulator